MSRSAHGAAWVAALTALWVYVLTLSPTVAWVNLGEDSGDLLVASATLGIAHPTGYPLFVLLGRVASLLPFGAIAFRINLVAALAGAASVYFLARLVLELTRPREGDGPANGSAGPVIAAFGAAAAYAFSRGAWSQSVLAEVYSLNAAFFGAVLWALARADRARSPRHLALAAFLLGLGLTNHLLLLAAAPALLVTAWRMRANRSIGGAFLVLLPLLFVWGISLDLYLPIRAWRSPEFSWGVPATPKQLWWVLSGAQYERHFFARGPVAVLRHLLPGRWLLDFGWGLAALAVGWTALAWKRPGGLLAMGAALVTSLALLSAYSIPDDVGYWMPVLFLACALAGVGWSAAWRALHAPGARGAVAAAALGVGVLGGIQHYRAVDASQDVRPWVWAHRNLEAVEPNALIVSEYDGRTFALWFYGATDFRRTDPGLVVIYKYLLVWPWYQHHLAHVYPTLAVPPYPGDMDAMMNRLIARNIKRRPVYLIRKDPALLPIFTLTPVGYPPDPIYRVGLKDDHS